METMNLSIERTPRTITFDGQKVQVEALSIRLPFARKPATIDELSGGEVCAVYVSETREMTVDEFDHFAQSLLKSRDWLRGKGGYWADARLCVEVCAPDRASLFVDPSGGDYGRYVAMAR